MTKNAIKKYATELFELLDLVQSYRRSYVLTSFTDLTKGNEERHEDFPELADMLGELGLRILSGPMAGNCSPCNCGICLLGEGNGNPTSRHGYVVEQLFNSRAKISRYADTVNFLLKNKEALKLEDTTVNFLDLARKNPRIILCPTNLTDLITIPADASADVKKAYQKIKAYENNLPKQVDILNKVLSNLPDTINNKSRARIRELNELVIKELGLETQLTDFHIPDDFYGQDGTLEWNYMKKDNSFSFFIRKADRGIDCLYKVNLCVRPHGHYDFTDIAPRLLADILGRKEEQTNGDDPIVDLSAGSAQHIIYKTHDPDMAKKVLEISNEDFEWISETKQFKEALELYGQGFRRKDPSQDLTKALEAYGQPLIDRAKTLHKQKHETYLKLVNKMRDALFDRLND